MPVLVSPPLPLNAPANVRLVALPTFTVTGEALKVIALLMVLAPAVFVASMLLLLIVKLLPQRA